MGGSGNFGLNIEDFAANGPGGKVIKGSEAIIEAAIADAIRMGMPEDQAVSRKQYLKLQLASSAAATGTSLEEITGIVKDGMLMICAPEGPSRGSESHFASLLRDTLVHAQDGGQGGGSRHDDLASFLGEMQSRRQRHGSPLEGIIDIFRKSAKERMKGADRTHEQPITMQIQMAATVLAIELFRWLKNPEVIVAPLEVVGATIAFMDHIEIGSQQRLEIINHHAQNYDMDLVEIARLIRSFAKKPSARSGRYLATKLACLVPILHNVHLDALDEGRRRYEESTTI